MKTFFIALGAIFAGSAVINAITQALLNYKDSRESKLEEGDWAKQVLTAAVENNISVKEAAQLVASEK